LFLMISMSQTVKTSVDPCKFPSVAMMSGVSHANEVGLIQCCLNRPLNVDLPGPQDSITRFQF
jgi:hypothetical protein